MVYWTLINMGERWWKHKNQCLSVEISVQLLTWSQAILLDADKHG